MATRQSIVTIVGLPIFYLFFFRALVWCAAGLLGAMGYKIPALAGNQGWIASAILAAIVWLLYVLRLGVSGIGASPRLNTLAVVGIAIAIGAALLMEIERRYPNMPADNADILGAALGIVIVHLHRWPGSIDRSLRRQR
jgi:hypothetical protein